MTKPSSVSRMTARRRFSPSHELGGGEQEAEGLRAAAPDAAAQLVQGGEAEALGLLDDHDGGLGHVHAHLHHRGRHEQLRPAGGEVAQGGLADIEAWAPWARRTVSPNTSRNWAKVVSAATLSWASPSSMARTTQ